MKRFYKKNVGYIASIGKYNGKDIFKYGFSEKDLKNDYKKYSERFDKFEILFITGCNDHDETKSYFEENLKKFNLHIQQMIYGIKYDDLFTFSPTYSIIFLINLFNDITKYFAEENEIKKLELERDITIKNIDKEVDMKRIEASLAIKEIEYNIEKEKTKQLCVQNKTKIDLLNESYSVGDISVKSKRNKKNIMKI
jgi:hypothetical protein